MASLQSWISDHKLATAGTLWASAVGASVAYTKKKYPLKGGVRMHAKVLTLAVISGLAIKHYYYDGERGTGDEYAYPAEWSEIGSGENEERASW